MKVTFSFLVLASFGLSGCRTAPGVERTTDLGYGFRRFVLAEPVRASFESIGYFEYLYYNDKPLSQIDDCSVSPSGRYVIFQGGPSGNLFLFRRSDCRKTPLTTHFDALVETFEWHEGSGTVVAHFASRHGDQSFILP